MKDKYKRILTDIGITVLVISVFFCFSLILHKGLGASELVTPLFVLAVFLVSLLTHGYAYGILSALISVLAVNFAFTFPFFAFNFAIHENIISALILIIVTIAASTLTTKIKNQEKVRARAEKEKLRADLLRAVSHDLRTPLTAIYGASSTLLENYEAIEEDSQKDILKGIQNDSIWLIRMVENLLSVTKLEREGVHLLKSPVVLEELVDSVLAKFKKHYPEREITLSLPEEFIVLSADAMLAQQVILNLLENAEQHATGLTELSLSVSVSGNNAVFSVKDDGCGIDSEKLKTIFSGYYMEEKAVKDNQKRCMGIGLSVCAAIIRAHGGEIEARNRKTGGMEFRFTLELEENIDE
ncbi:MAG: PAS domain-containing sensor histidine kinase [Clostridia bacterium]|nr:PAS domain-containing sensor histidine kinase [Clostridia bacterium]